MEILTFENSDEVEKFTQLLLNPDNQYLFGSDNHASIGAITTNPGKTNSWYWVTNGNRITFDMDFQNLDNAGDIESCLGITKAGGFCDINCNKNDYRFICQHLVPKPDL